MKKLNLFEIVESFGDVANSIYTSKHKEIMSELVEYYDAIDRIEKLPISEDDKILYLKMLDTVNPRPLMHLKSLEHMRKVKNMHRNSSKDFNQNALPIAQAKNVPIAELIEFKKQKKNMVSCPFHADATPSMKINKDNTVKCFSCGFFGDSIALIQKLNGVTFVESVKFIMGVKNETART